VHGEVKGGGAATELLDSQLYALLHVTTLSCSEFAVHSFIRVPNFVPDHDNWEEWRQSEWKPMRRVPDFDWADIRLPAVTRLRLLIQSYPTFTGCAGFITLHTALVELTSH